MQRAGPDPSGQRRCKLRLELLAKKKAVRRVCHCKEVGLQEWLLAGRATIPRVLYGIGLHMSLRQQTILLLRVPARVALTIHTFCRQISRWTGPYRSSFRSGRGENFVDNRAVKFGKPLFADMHHRVHAVAGALWKPNVACPHPDVSTGWPVMRSTLSSHPADASVLTFRRPYLFLHLHQFLPKIVAIDFRCVENHGGTTHS